MQANIIQQVIHERWGLVRPEQWQVKHLRWYLQEHLKTKSPATRYRHWLTVAKIVQRLAKNESWMPYLQGPWTCPSPQ
jgi:hypothetical protein